MRTVICILLLITVFSRTVPAQPKKPVNVVYFDGYGMYTRPPANDPSGKIDTTYTIAGFADIKAGRDSSYFRRALNYVYYFNKDDAAKKEALQQKRPLSAGLLISKIFLQVNDEYAVDVLDAKTDTLVCRRIIKRLYVVPRLAVISRDRYGFHSLSNGTEMVNLGPGDSLIVTNAALPAFANNEVVYRLENYTKGSTITRITRGPFIYKDFEPGERYVLRYSYLAQPENSRLLNISVGRPWYRSPVTYLIVVSLVSALSIILIIQLSKRKLKVSHRKQIALEQSALRLQSQLNPHFTFNALSSIQGLMNTNRIDDANYYLQEFSWLLRKALEKSQQVFTTLDQELDIMRAYIRLEALRFGFSWKLEVSEGINPTIIEIPALLLQPLIENSIKHGLSARGDKGQLRIFCMRGEEPESLVITVMDNGEWIEPGKETGYGLSLTNERIRTINAMDKSRRIDISFNKRAGTKVVLTFHNWINP